MRKNIAAYIEFAMIITLIGIVYGFSKEDADVMYRGILLLFVIKIHNFHYVKEETKTKIEEVTEKINGYGDIHG